METNENIGVAVKCDHCGCAFVPEVLTRMEGDIEYTFFQCDYCGKATMVTVSDEPLRKSIEEYVRLGWKNKEKRLPEKEQRQMQALKAANVARARELRRMYLKEGDGYDGE